MVEVVNIDGMVEMVHATFLSADQKKVMVQPKGFGTRLIPIPRNPGTNVLDLSPFNATVSYHPDDLIITVLAGKPLQELHDELQMQQQWLPFWGPDGDRHTIGGLIASGMDGAYRARYGPLYERVLAMEIYTPALGQITVGAPVVKNVAGYNLPRLFSGSRGSFGVILSVTLKVAPLPQQTGIWHWTGERQELQEKAAMLSRLGHPWATQLLVRHPAMWHLYAVWHGHHKMIRQLGDAIGMPDATEHLPVAESKTCSAIGAVPKETLPGILQAVSPSTTVMGDMQSGWVWASGDYDTVSLFEKLVREVQGGLLWMRSDRPPNWPRIPYLESVYSRMKTAYDPKGTLPDYWDG